MNKSFLKTKNKVLTRIRCKRCAKGSIVTDNEIGELICDKCGYVLPEKIEDHGPEHRNFLDGSTDRSRTGDAILLSRHDRGLSTIIDRSDKDASGNNLSSAMRNTINRLRIWDVRSQTRNTVDINMKRAFNDLSRLKDKLGLSAAIVEKSAYIYRKAMEKRLTKGRTIISVISASVYIACRDAETSRTLNDIALAGNIKRKDLTKTYRLLIQELDLKVPQLNPILCLTRAANTLGVSEKTKRYALNIIDEYKKSSSMDGKSPMGVAATVLYLATSLANESFSQKQVADAANVTEVTIRNRSKEMKEKIDLDDPLLQKKIVGV